MALVVRWTTRESEIGVLVLGCPSMSHPTGCSGSPAVQPQGGRGCYSLQYCFTSVHSSTIHRFRQVMATFYIWVGQAGYFYCTKEVKQTDLNVQSKNKLHKNKKCCAHQIFKDIVQVTFSISIVPWTTYCDDIKPWVFGIVISLQQTLQMVQTGTKTLLLHFVSVQS